MTKKTEPELHLDKSIWPPLGKLCTLPNCKWPYPTWKIEVL